MKEYKPKEPPEEIIIHDDMLNPYGKSQSAEEEKQEQEKAKQIEKPSQGSF